MQRLKMVRRVRSTSVAMLVLAHCLSTLLLDVPYDTLAVAMLNF